MTEFALGPTTNESHQKRRRVFDCPVLVLGCPRSGTSLLSRMLNAHPNIGIPFESQLYHTFYPWLKYYGDLSQPHRRERLVNDILATAALRLWSPRPEAQQILAEIQRYDFHGVVEGLMRAWIKRVGKQRWGEKSPNHAFWWRQFLTGFPHMQILHIVRDGRDVALSWQKVHFGPKHIYPMAQEWVRYIQAIQACRCALPDDMFYELRYEDLVTAPERTLAGICQFLGEEYSANMLSFFQSKDLYKTDRVNVENLKRPVMQQNSAKWKTHMTPYQWRIFEAVAGPMLEQFGYETHCENPQITRREIWQFQYIEHPPRKAWAMLKNFQGQIDGLRRLMIYLRLRISPPHS